MEGRGTNSSRQAIDTRAYAPMDGWSTLPWKKFHRHVFKLQTRIYRVRKVTQENQGKKTAGVDGVKSLTPPPTSHVSSQIVSGTTGAASAASMAPETGHHRAATLRDSRSG